MSTQALHSIAITRLDGSQGTLADYAGKLLLVVNVASACGLTPQYEGLEALYRKYGPRGLVVLGVPSNQFGAQEPGTAEQIKTFCETRFDVSFPLLAKSDVNGPNAHPLYVQLKSSEAGGGADISWNFEKFLVGKDGEVLRRYAPRTLPEQLDVDIAEALGA